MRTAVSETSRRVARRELLVGGFTLIMAAVGLAALVTVALLSTRGGVWTGGVGATGSLGDERPSLVVFGRGEAAVPAERATLQLLIGPGYYDDGIGSADPSEGEPGVAERAAVEPLLHALLAQGVAETDVGVVISPAIDVGYGGPEGAQFGVRLDVAAAQPTLERLNQLINAAGSAAIGEQLALAQVGVGYAVADCSDLERQARALAMEDARANARQQADLLGVPLGDLLLSSDAPPAGRSAAAPTACGQSSASAPTFSFDSAAVTVPAFDPATPADAKAAVEVSLTFALPSR